MSNGSRDHRGKPPTPPAKPSPEVAEGGPVVRDHRGEPQSPRPGVPPPPHEGSDGPIRDHRATGIKHIFVLMLENRSFDHMLGFSGITGTDAATGKLTAIDGLVGTESNTYADKVYKVSQGASDVMSNGPGHSFTDVLEQLCGEGVKYPSHGVYPPITNAGFASSYAKVNKGDPGAAMKCFTPAQVPVLTTLAREFVVCDRWFCSMPGPTEPNRMFVHAASAGEFDESPSQWEITKAIGAPYGGFEFKHGTIFKRLKKADVKFRIYADDHFPNVAELGGVSVVRDIDEYENFAEDVSSSSYDAAYTFIEPAYDALESFEDGNSQHPRGSVAAGERFIKTTYEAIRKSPIWNQSVLVILWDEHGGFYDHVPPGSAYATGTIGESHGFTFEQLGPRVPAVIVSPLVPKNQIEHRVLEHCSIPATLARVFKFDEINTRSNLVSGINHLARLETPRTDTPMTLPAAAAAPLKPRIALKDAVARVPDAALIDGPQANYTALIHSAVAQHLEVAPEGERKEIIARALALKTQAELLAYMKEVHALVQTARAKAGIKHSASVRVHE